MFHKVSPRNVPWGPPRVTGRYGDLDVWCLTHCVRCDKKLKTRVISDGFTLIDRSLLAKISGFSKLNALLKSMNNAWTPYVIAAAGFLSHISLLLCLGENQGSGAIVLVCFVYGRGVISACFQIAGNIPVCMMVLVLLVIGAESMNIVTCHPAWEIRLMCRFRGFDHC